MRSALALSLPWPPSTNALWMPVNAGGRVFMSLTKRARHYHQEVMDAIVASLGKLRLEPLTGRVRCEVELRAPDRRKRDLDNHAKGLLDALTKCRVWLDDEQVDELIIRRGPLTSGGAALVLVTEL